jgi:hypothetical protein
MAAIGMSRTGNGWLPALDPTEREAEVLEIAKLFVGRGVDLEVADRSGQTAVAGAKLLGYESVAQYLLASGAKEPPAPAANPTRPGRPPL